MHLTRRAAIAVISASLAAPPADAAPAARRIDGPWDRFGAAPGPSHAEWEDLLAAHLSRGTDGVARLDYGAMPVARVRGYVSALLAADPTGMTRDAAFAFWANLYNAVTVLLVLEAYPVASIRDVRGGLFRTGPWKDKLVSVNGIRLSLDDMEHGILRPIWRDLRIHYAVNCAALGCPDLRLWRADGLDGDLDAAARAYVNHPRGASVSAGRLAVSSIYDWFREDFGGSDANVIAHLRSHADPALAADLRAVTRIHDDRYDWSLNDASGPGG